MGKSNQAQTEHNDLMVVGWYNNDDDVQFWGSKSMLYLNTSQHEMCKKVKSC
jgi:hypothetical protein